MKSISIIAAAASGLLATAAFATPAPAPLAGAATSVGILGPDASANERVCVKQTPTGSRIPRKLCQTRAQWTAQGVDIDKADR